MRRFKKLIFVFMLLSIFSASNVYGSSFLDIEDKSASEKVELVTDLGFLYYDLVPYFSPDALLTRKEAAEIMYILDKGYLYNDGKVNYISSYKDVYKNDYIINYCKENGILRGFSDNTFKPNSPATYADVIAMFVKTLKLDKHKVLQYPDEYIKVADSVGLLAGINYKKDGIVNNLNAAKMIYNALTLSASGNDKSLLETRFDSLHKLVQETNSSIETVLKLFEKADSQIDMQKIDEALNGIYANYKTLSSSSVNIEFKYNIEIQFLKKINSYLAKKQKLEQDTAELANVEVFTDFAKYYALMNEYSEYKHLLNADANTTPRFTLITEKILKILISLCDKELAEVESRLPTWDYFVNSYKLVESSAVDTLNNKVIKKSVSVEFFEDDNWVDDLINMFDQIKPLFAFFDETGDLKDETYYDKMAELNYIIESIYFIKGYESSSEGESADMKDEFELGNKLLLLELQGAKFKYYEPQKQDIIKKITEMLPDTKPVLKP